MPKRSAQEKLDSYRKKIRKIEEKEKRKREKQKSYRRIRRPLIKDSSDDEINEDTITQNTTEVQIGPSASTDDLVEISALQTPTAVPAGQDTATALLPETVTESPDVSLDPELLSALGASTSDTPEFGENIHQSLSNLWGPILKKGLPKEDKDKLLKEYLLPGNCKLLQAPKLNAEISAAVAEMVRGRDKKLVRFQHQLGVGIAAVNRGMDTLLTSDSKIVALKQLSDGCRFLTDLHNLLTKDRIKLVIPSLEKNFLNVIQDSERDETLFGNSLSEKIKASQAINKQGSQIKAITNNKPAGGATSNQSATSRSAQGNWTGPPRFHSNRGGRGSQRKPMLSTIRRTYPQTQIKSVHQPKTRAAPH